MNTIYLEPWKPRLIIRPNRVSSLVSAGGSACIPGKLWVAVPWHRARALTPRSRVKDFRPPARGVLCPPPAKRLAQRITGTAGQFAPRTFPDQPSTTRSPHLDRFFPATIKRNL